MTVFCDNGDCCYIGEDGFCGCDKLSIVGGVCAGSYRSGRNACDGDVDERLRVENAKLRELVRWMYDRMDESCAVQYPYAPAPISYDRLMQALARARELGVEVDG